MVCNSALQAAYHQMCTICGRTIGYSDYQISKTKSRKFKEISYPSKTLYFHTKCYNMKYGKNLHIPDIK